MQLKLYNTMSKEKETFSPLNKSEARIYACGPTVYHYQHIGNLRNYLFNDILKRVLLFNKYKVKQVINITDVGHLTSDEDSGEDKMIKALKREKLDISEESLLTLAKKYEAVWQNDMVKINILPAEVYCKATEHVKDMVEMIEKIEKNGFSYESDSCVYFDISKFKDYNKLARLKLENLEAGARVAVDKEKKNPGDFVLWFKTVGKHEKHIMQWDSKYGKGFPGWHIECSAMSVKYLGEQFDIHTGGIEHVPVHHTNEIAQTEASTGKKPWVKYWMHGEHLTLAKEKMSKSLGNVFLLDDLIKKGFDPLAFRYLCLGSHYRKQMIFTLESLEGAQNSLNKLRNKLTKFSDNDIVLLNVGMFWKNKNQRFLIKLLSNLEYKYKLILIGVVKKEQENYYQQVITDIKKMSLEDRVEIVSNFINNPYDYMSLSDVYLFPSRHEGLGTPILEAQACGKPVIAYGKGGALETIVPLDENIKNEKEQSGNATGMFFYDQAPESLAQAVVRFEEAQDLFNWQVIRKNAESFDRTIFKDTINKYIEKEYKEFRQGLQDK